jgi:2-phospho-L-lactate guanylyltransferase
MHVVVPFDGSEPKTRLAPVLADAERTALAEAMLRDVLETVRGAGHAPTVLATASVDVDAPVSVDERPLSTAVNAVLAAREPPVAVVMADLPLVTPDALGRLLAPEADVALAPGLGGGTNAFLARDPGFRVDYHDGSYRKHRQQAVDRGASVATVDSFRLALDVDEPGDLVEVLLHGEGHAETWLRRAGFDLVSDERGLAARRPDPL